MKQLLTLLTLIFLPVGINADEFSWKDTEGKHRDLFHGGKLVARYMYERIDISTPERRELTYKPFYHIFDRDSGIAITNGAGGKFPHHSGIYYGFSKCSYTDSKGNIHKGIDTWHCRKAHQIHDSFISQSADNDIAGLTTEIFWIGNDGEKIASEKRTQIFSFSGNDLTVSFRSSLTSNVPSLTLDGDPQHAGFQFRASNEVAAKYAKETYYIRPETGKAPMGKTINWSAKSDSESTRNLPWKGMSFIVGGNRYTTAYLDHPDNPKPGRYSERDYGRFGSYFVKKDLKMNTSLVVNYRLVIRNGEMTPDEIAGMSSAFLKSPPSN